ncbi:phosphotransferase enzyme family protein [Gluconobacter sphaericus]|uniref:phosphotransferase enzyme family protein n=1 Tax=Gluconobacter sphaericus TaxID=574987 RepID=UPI00312BBC8D
MTHYHADPLTDTALQALAEEAMTQYAPHFHGRVSLLTRSENATFRIDTPTGRYAMRIHRPDYHDHVAIESEIQWLSALDNDIGLGVPTAITSSDGKTVLTCAMDDGSHRHVVLFHWVEGEMPTANVDPRSFRRLGLITARLHQHSRSWARPEGFKRIRWDHETMVGPHAHWGDWRKTKGLNERAIATIEAAMTDVRRKLVDFGQKPSRFGLIHADLRLTNLLLSGDETRVIDFDDCGMGWFLHDLAAAISFEEHHRSAAEWIANWLEGYESLVPLSPDEHAIIPALVIQRRVQLTSWVASHADTEMARSLGADWIEQTVRLCEEYLTTSSAA